MTQKDVGKGTAGVGPTCHLLTCRPRVGVMSTDMCSSCWYVANMSPTCCTSINRVEQLILCDVKKIIIMIGKRA